MVRRTDLHESGRIDIIVRRLKVNTVKGIKHIEAELGHQLFPNREILAQAEVRVGIIGSAEGIATSAAKVASALGTNADFFNHSAAPPTTGYYWAETSEVPINKAAESAATKRDCLGRESPHGRHTGQRK